MERIEHLRHVVWLGGSPRAGKTTLARSIAGKYDLKIYGIDGHYWQEYQQHLDPVRHPVSYAMKDTPIDEWWVRPEPDAIVARAITLWEETFEFILDDLLALPASRVVLAEGPGALPWLVAPLLASAHQAAFVVPTADFRDEIVSMRKTADLYGRTSDPEHARLNHRAHDLALGDRIRKACDELGFPVVEATGRGDLVRNAAWIEDWLRPFVPTTLNL